MSKFELSRPSQADPLSNPTEITIAQVAQIAGVSVSTVSRILNNKPDVAPSTRQRVQQVIDELGYTPHAQAQRLAAGAKSRSMALIYPLEYRSFTTYLELDFFIGAATTAGESNYFFYLFTTPISKNNLLSLYRSGQVDGVILMEIKLQDWRVELLRDHGYPFVMIGHSADNTGLSYIDLDFEAATMAAFDHLVELGHRQIAYLGMSATMNQQGFGPAVRSLDGFEKTCRKHNIPVIHREVEATVQAMSEATTQVIQDYPNLTAIVASNGQTVVGVIRALRKLGRTIPDNFSVVALTAERAAQLVTPPLTAIDFPSYLMGSKAAEMLVNLLNNDTPEVTQIMLPPKLVIRQSTGPASK